MLPVWARLAAVAKEAEPGLPCACKTKSDCISWTMRPDAEEFCKGIPLCEHLDDAADICAKAAQNPAASDSITKRLGVTFAALLKIQTFAVPKDLTEDGKAFREKLAGLVTWESWELRRGVDWPLLFDEYLETRFVDGFEGIVRHYDPHLQLIYFPSFRFFLEVQCLRQAVHELMSGWRANPMTKSAWIAAWIGTYDVLARCCVKFHAEAMGLSGGQPADQTEATATAPPPVPRLSANQKKRLKRQAKRREAAVAKAAAQTSADDPTSSTSPSSAPGAETASETSPVDSSAPKETPQLPPSSDGPPTAVHRQTDAPLAQSRPHAPSAPPRLAAKDAPKPVASEKPPPKPKAAPEVESVPASSSLPASPPELVGGAEAVAPAAPRRKPSAPLALPTVEVETPSSYWALLARSNRRLLRLLRATPMLQRN